MGPRRYGRTSITLVPSSAVGVFDAMGDGGDGSASETVGSSFHMGDPLENESAHVPIMDGFDFSSSTSAWKPDSKPIAAPEPRSGGGEREGGRGDAQGASGRGEGVGGEKERGGGGSPAKSTRGRTHRGVTGVMEPVPVQQVPNVSTAFIGEHGEATAKLDELEFAVDGLHAGQTLEVRTGATLQLAKLCRDPDMRQLLRAHSLLLKVVEGLESIVAGESSLSSSLSSSLAFPAAAALFYLCQVLHVH